MEARKEQQEKETVQVECSQVELIESMAGFCSNRGNPLAQEDLAILMRFARMRDKIHAYRTQIRKLEEELALAETEKGGA